jgi:hypothetical protein
MGRMGGTGAKGGEKKEKKGFNRASRYPPGYGTVQANHRQFAYFNSPFQASSIRPKTWPGRGSFDYEATNQDHS